MGISRDLFTTCRYLVENLQKTRRVHLESYYRTRLFSFESEARSMAQEDLHLRPYFTLSSRYD